MSAPNMINATSVYAKTTGNTPAGISAEVLLANSAASGKVLKINTITAANVDGTNAYAATVAYNTLANGAGTSYPVASTISVPANATLIILDKSNALYLEEDKSIVVTAGGASKISFVVSYEEIS